MAAMMNMRHQETTLSVCPVDDLDRARDEREADRDIREQEPKSPRVLGLDPAVRDKRRRSQAGEHDHHETDEPADGNHAPGPDEPAHRGGRTRCRDGERTEPEHDHPDRDDLIPALAAAEEHIHGDRDQHDVAERVGEADRRREETAVAGRIDLVENDDPAAEEHGSRDHHPVDHRPDAPGEGLDGARDQEEPDRGERRSPR